MFKKLCEINIKLKTKKTNAAIIGTFLGISIVITHYLGMKDSELLILKASLGEEARIFFVIILCISTFIVILNNIYNNNSTVPDWLMKISKVGINLFTMNIIMFLILLVYSVTLSVFSIGNMKFTSGILSGFFISVSCYILILLSLYSVEHDYRHGIKLFLSNRSMQFLYLILNIIFITILIKY